MHKILKNSRNLTSEQETELKKNAIGVLADHRRFILDKFPFIGSIAMQMELVPVRDVRLTTAATDGHNIYFDIDFLSSLTPNEAQFVLAHELFHAVMNHFLRGAGREHDIMNIAEDLEVNQILVKEGLTVPSSACMPNKFQVPCDLSAEEYYEILIKRQPPQNGPGESGSGNGSGSDKGESSKQPDNSPSETGDPNGKVQGQFDKHLNNQQNVNEELDPGNISDKYGKIGFDKDFQPNPCQENVEKIREAAVAAATDYERSRGSLPAHLQKFVNKLLKPEISWKDVLSSFVTRTVGSDTNWNRPNRRFVSSHTYLPSRESESIRVGVIIDTSGSTANDIPKFLGEVNSLVKSFSGYEMTVVQCDTEVQSCETYAEDNPLDLENTKFQVNGGGGTVIYPAFKHIEENDIDVDALVVFTDGYTEEFTEDMDPGIPTLWMVTKGGCTSNFKFGEVHEFKIDN